MSKMEADVTKEIENKIISIRGTQVMLDSDLAKMYQVETKILNQAVKRNLERFPRHFRFQLIKKEYDGLKSQFVTSSLAHGGRRTLPYVFTEQGVAMLSTVLRSDFAVKVSINIMQAFVNMRKFLIQNASVFQRIDHLELKQLQTDEKLNRVFKALEAGQAQPDKGIFFEGQIFDAYSFVAGIIKKASSEIILIDNYVDETVLTLLAKRRPQVSATIYTKSTSKSLQLDVEKHNAQYPAITVKTFAQSHDRFLVIDQKELYHIGASLKDLGKKWFAFSKMDSLAEQVVEKLKKGAL